MNKHKTARGKEFNMQTFATNNGDKVAVGNTNRNARGDLLGPGGKIIATAQQITNRVHDQNSARGDMPDTKINPGEQEVNRKQVVGADGKTRWEITYADGSMEMILEESSDQDDVDLDMSFFRKEL